MKSIILVLTVATVVPILLAASYIGIDYTGALIISDPDTRLTLHGLIVLLATLLVGVVGWHTS